MAKHQQASPRQPGATCVAIPAPTADAIQEFLCVQLVPGVVGLSVNVHLAILVKAVNVQVIQPITLQYFAVAGVFHLLSEHSANGLLTLELVGTVKSFIGAEQRVAFDVYRSLLSGGLGHMDMDDRVALDFQYVHPAVT